MSAQAQMPKYKCHKEVWALKIEFIAFDSEIALVENRETDGSAWMHPVEPGYSPLRLDAGYLRKHKPQIGGYFIAYEDGYISYSPAEAFESGYTLIKE